MCTERYSGVISDYTVQEHPSTTKGNQAEKAGSCCHQPSSRDMREFCLLIRQFRVSSLHPWLIAAKEKYLDDTILNGN